MRWVRRWESSDWAGAIVCVRGETVDLVEMEGVDSDLKFSNDQAVAHT